jgi:molybdate transport system ATP-binding protein
MADNSVPVDKLISDNIQGRFNLAFTQKSKKSFALDIDIQMPGQGVTAIFGESGSGKTTLLRCIAGLERGATGLLSVKGEVWQNASKFVPTHKRSIGYVFQEASLFAHLSVMANLNYAIKRSCSQVEPSLLEQVIMIMGIKNILTQMPAQLSGGEKQRVAIARALLRQPKLLLMDEPLASLDTARKREILPYLDDLRSQFNMPILYVTHSLDEIAQLADYAVIMHQGKVTAQGEATALFSKTELPLGVDNELGALIDCKVLSTDEQWHLMQVAFDGGCLWLPKVSNNKPTRRIRILASDVSLTLTQPSDTSIVNVLSGKIVTINDNHQLATCVVSVLVGKTLLLAQVTKKSAHKLALHTDQSVWVQIKSAAIVR